MKEKIYILFLIFSTFCVAQDLSTSNKETKIKPGLKDKIIISLNNLKNSDPETDFKNAIKKKDFRFIGVNGYSLTLPGVKVELQFSLKDKYGVRIIEYTGDQISSPEESEINILGRKYAKEYNLLLIKYLKIKNQ